MSALATSTAAVQPYRSVGALLIAASRITGVSPAMIRGKDRTPNIVRIRDAVIWCARTAHGVSQSHLGRALDDRDHSTIRIAFNRAEQRINRDGDFALLCGAITDAQLVCDMATPA